MVFYIKKVFLNLFLGKRKTFSELKKEFALCATVSLQEIRKNKIEEKEIEKVVDLFVDYSDESNEILNTWAEKIADSITPKLFERKYFLLKKYRWDIARLREEEHKMLHELIEDYECECNELVTDKIKDALLLAEEKVAMKRYEESFKKLLLQNDFIEDDLLN